MDPLLIVGIGLTLFLGSVLQGAVGFAYTLFSLPILVWLNIELNQAVAMVVVTILVQVAVSVYQLRASVQWKRGVGATLIRYATLPLGLLILQSLQTVGQVQIKQLVGGLLLLALLTSLGARIQPREHVHAGWSVLAFSLSGLLQGIAAMGGPPLVLWVMAHPWDNRQTRGFLLSLMLMSLPYQVLLLYLTFGPRILEPMLAGLGFSPVVILGALLGVRLGDRFSKPLLRRLSYWILGGLAFSSILAPWLGA